MDKGTELEQAIFDVIQETLRSDADVKAAKEYFKNTLVIDLIEEGVSNVCSDRSAVGCD